MKTTLTKNSMPKRTPPHLIRWLNIGRKNLWIREAEDPTFDFHSFTQCDTYAELADWVLKGNWCLGQAFYCKDICLINQVHGGDEWLVIKGDIPFESFTCSLIGRERLISTLEDIEASTEEECKRLEYRKKTGSMLEDKEEAQTV